MMGLYSQGSDEILIFRKRNLYIGVLVILFALPAGEQDITTAENFFDTVSENYSDVRDYIASVSINLTKAAMEGTLF